MCQRSGTWSATPPPILKKPYRLFFHFFSASHARFLLEKISDVSRVTKGLIACLRYASIHLSNISRATQILATCDLCMVCMTQWTPYHSCQHNQRIDMGVGKYFGNPRTMRRPRPSSTSGTATLRGSVHLQWLQSCNDEHRGRAHHILVLPHVLGRAAFRLMVICVWCLSHVSKSMSVRKTAYFTSCQGYLLPRSGRIVDEFLFGYEEPLEDVRFGISSTSRMM